MSKKVKIYQSYGAKNKKPFYKRVWFILFVIMLVIGAINSIVEHRNKKINWKEIELCERLPKPKSNIGKIFENDSDALNMYVEKTSEKDYRAYIKKCKSMGYTVESEEDGEQYDALDSKGYALSLYYIDDTMHINLNAPMGTFNWPKSEIASLLPMPKSNIGEISTDTSEECYIYVGETSIDDFNSYVDECSERGFSVDYERRDKSYNAKDEKGNQLFLYYEGNRVMTIQIQKSDKD